MAKDVQTKKRKASQPETEVEKVKKVKKIIAIAPEVELKKRKATEDAAPVALKKSKTPKSAKSTTNLTPVEKDDGVIAKVKKAKKTVTARPTVDSDDKGDAESIDDEVDSEVDDQTEALLKGFESDGDDADADNDEGLIEGQEVPKAPKLSKANQKKLKAAGDGSEEPGVVYVGRIPHGFYENEMRQYFKQFGNILKLRLSRNKRTGASKHYAFIQFESSVVADIVARTMDNYLLFGHILKVKTIANEQVSEELFKGANKRFKKVPWDKLEGRKLKQGASEEVWEQRKAKEEKRRAEKAEKLKQIGYEFEAPPIKSAKGLAAKQAAINGESETKLIEATPTTQEPAESEKGKTAKDESEAIETAIVPVESAKSKKAKKSKTAKETVGVPEVDVTTEFEVTKAKQKSTKSDKVEILEQATSSAEVPEKKVKTKKSKTVVADEAGLETVKTKKSKKAKSS